MVKTSLFLAWFSAPLLVYCMHRKMEEMNARDSFVAHSQPEGHIVHEVVFAVKQNNLDLLEAMLMERSTPLNAKYQQWLSFEEVSELTSNEDGAAAIKQWLTESQATVTWESVRKDYIKASAPVVVWNELLNTSFQLWQDVTRKGYSDESNLIMRSVEYSIPEHLTEHVEAVFNTVQVPPVVHKAFYRSPDNTEKKSTLRVGDYFKTTAFTVPKVTVSFLNSFYGVPSNIGSALQNQSVFETSKQSFSPNDLTQFQKTYGLTKQAAIDIGGFTSNACSPSGSPTNCFEGNLDLQYIMGISQVTSTVYWYVGGSDPFVDWITDVADEAHPPQSNSVSWGSVEQQNSVSVMNSFNTEALKLSAIGVTVMVSSGDDGVANSGCACNSAKATSSSNCACSANSGKSASNWGGSNSWTGTGYFPSFPATCPYVTAVGATMFSKNSQRPERACQSQLDGIITTGGGFSTFYAQPSWQTTAVNTYFAGLSTAPNPGYNAKGRAYPDISLLGVNYQVILSGQTYALYGTSASSPVFAAFISLINAQRLAQNRPLVGFINPTLYAYGSDPDYAFYNDVTSGSNNCCANNSPSTKATICCKSGFNATRGWDPLTGWGSINFGNLTALLDMVPHPTFQPTFAPSAAPSVTPLPSRAPSAGPTPVAGAPTLVPTIANIIAVSMTQVITGTSLSASSFTQNPGNTLTVQQSVMASVNGSQSVDITSVVDYTGTARVRGRKLATVTGVTLGYTVSVNNGAVSSSQSYDDVSAQITTSVSNGQFDTLMNTYGAEFNAPLLVTASSDEVVVSETFASPTAAPASSPSGNSLGSNTVIAIAVVVAIAVFVAVAVGVFCACRKSADHSGAGAPTAASAPRTAPPSQDGPAIAYANPLKTTPNPSASTTYTANATPPPKPAKPAAAGKGNKGDAKSFHKSHKKTGDFI